jgi:hypothetical protein
LFFFYSFINLKLKIMKKIFTLLVCAAVISAQAQTIYSENFEGASPTFTLNTADLSSSTNGYNKWIINNVYTGGSFDHPCLPGFPIPIGNTAAQPSGITGFPNSKYLHIVNTDAEAGGVTNANFLSSDGNMFCVGDQNYFAKMTTPISTTGLTNVNISYYWMCGGAAGSAYGEVYYSTNGGSSWTQQGGAIYGQTSWTQATASNPLWDNQASLLFGFRFYNAYTGASPTDPPICLDEFTVFVPASNTVTTGTITGSPFCAGDNMVVPYTISGSFTAGNVFTAQLSDGAGSFASPTNIGNVTSTSAGNINCVIPPGTASGLGYQVRVTSSTPAITGTSSLPLTINARPTPTATNTGPYCAGAPIQLNSPSGFSTDDWTGPNSYVQGNTQNPVIAGSTVGMSGVYTVTVTNVSGCSATATTTVVVNNCAGIADEGMAEISVYPNPTTDMFTISLSDDMLNNAQVSVFNMVGESVYTMTPNQTKTMISTESLGLKAGIYLVQVRYKEQKKVVRLIVR